MTLAALRFLTRTMPASGLVILFLLGFSSPSFAQQTPPYRDAKLPIEQRIDDLLGRMTLEEKVAQMEGAWENLSFHKDPKTLIVDDKGNFMPDRAALLLKNGLGELSRPSEPIVNRGPRAMAEYTNTIQKWFLENTRLGIPVLFHEEMPSRTGGARRNVLSAGDRNGFHLGSGFGAASLFRHRRRGAFPWSGSLPCSGARFGSRPAMGPHGRDLW